MESSKVSHVSLCRNLLSAVQELNDIHETEVTTLREEVASLRLRAHISTEPLRGDFDAIADQSVPAAEAMNVQLRASSKRGNLIQGDRAEFMNPREGGCLEELAPRAHTEEDSLECRVFQPPMTRARVEMRAPRKQLTRKESLISLHAAEIEQIVARVDSRDMNDNEVLARTERRFPTTIIPGSQRRPSLHRKGSKASSNASWASFASLTSLTQTLGYDAPWRERLRHFFKTIWAEIVPCMMVSLNCFYTAGVAQALLTEVSDGFQLFLFFCELFLSTAFCLEVLLRWMAFGFKAFSPTKSLDTRMRLLEATVVLFTSIVFLAVWAPRGPHYLDEGNRGWLYGLFMVPRAFLLVRWFRVVKSLEHFKDITNILLAMTGSVFTFLWSVVALFVVDFIFSVIWVMTTGIQLRILVEEETIAFGAPGPELKALWRYFGTFPDTMRTFAEVFTKDQFYEELLQVSNYIGWSWYLLHTYIATVNLLIVNLVTALVVDNALANSKMNEEREKSKKDLERKKEMDGLTDLFKLMDENGDGTLSWDEFKGAFTNHEIAEKWRSLDFAPDEAKAVFSLLDKGDGQIPIEDFFEGLKRMKGLASSKDVFYIIKTLDEVKRFVTGKETLPENERTDTAMSDGMTHTWSEPYFYE